jgi:hypothetical protein
VAAWVKVMHLDRFELGRDTGASQRATASAGAA